jgi:hypothetical protein
MDDFNDPAMDASAAEQTSTGVRAAMDARTLALYRRYDSDDGFREAVDDLVAATGLLLPETSIDPEVDEVVSLARLKRNQG